LQYRQEGAAVKGPPAMGPSLQLSTCVLFWSFLACARRQGILTPPAKYQVDRTTAGEVMGIFRQQRN